MPMENAISITTSRDAQLEAASLLSKTLTDLGCAHAYIGGFAWALLGSRRLTEDIDVLIEIENFEGQSILKIRQQLSTLNQQFAEAGLKFYFVKELSGSLTGEQLVRANKGNVMIETLQAGQLGLPKTAGPIYELRVESGPVFNLLHPGVLILTKMNRWSVNRESTRPKTIRKQRSDTNDLRWLVIWLAAEQFTIDFDNYKGKTREQLLGLVSVYRETMCAEDKELMEALKKAMKPADWILL
ncbi:hypothetical protein BDP27DRAFT_1327126 [Rhodocollybia butyracea]|uniref:Uncharacterized protein n=1 Tax=Rhodocollybia butyracea TaxID=206335 RepID=A0A9P5U6Z2_9AGAR|nr:hypothetical protein BDP27DRAFT_1327126 [Rhodocollybia butyracea]